MKQVIAEISARHLHISKKDLEKLFGKGYILKKLKSISQPGEFASTVTVDLINGKKVLKKVRVVGPTRKATQIELALTDCYALGIKPVLRVSGDLKNTPGITIKGPKGSVKVANGVIIPKRHLHISTKQAKAWKLKNKQKVRAIAKGHRSVVFNEVIVRVGNYNTRIHLDTDEANAAGLLSCSKIDLDI